MLPHIEFTKFWWVYSNTSTCIWLIKWIYRQMTLERAQCGSLDMNACDQDRMMIFILLK